MTEKSLNFCFLLYVICHSSAVNKFCFDICSCVFLVVSMHFDYITVMILSFRTDRPGQTVQTQIRLLLEEQSNQGLHCLPFRLHRLDSFSMVEPHNSNFRVITTNFLSVRKLRIITVLGEASSNELCSLSFCLNVLSCCFY